MMATLDDFEVWSQNLYRLGREFDPDDYMSDTAQVSARKINQRGLEWLSDKSKLRERLPSDWLLREYGCIVRGEHLEFEDADLDIETALFETDVVLKDVGASDGDYLWFMPQAMNPESRKEALAEALKRSYINPILVTELAHQHPYADAIWPYGSNTIRLLVFTPGEERPQIAASVHKWGTLFSGSADNWNRGGLTSVIHNGVLGETMEDFTLKTQRGGNGSKRTPMFPCRPLRLLKHHEHNTTIMGVRIPFWSQLEEIVISASDILREDLPYIGWDVIVTEDGPKIIEGNPWPGIQLMQVHFPLFGNIRFREFMESYGVRGL